jgi:hypothetical protein
MCIQMTQATILNAKEGREVVDGISNMFKCLF